MEAIFTAKYERGGWGGLGSGPGSTLEFNQFTYIPFLQKFLTDYSIRSVVDVGCGDFQCGSAIYSKFTDISYCGIDCCQKVIEKNKKLYSPFQFLHSDVSVYPEQIPSADLCILKDVLQHWDTETIVKFLDFLVSSQKFHYILLINCCNQTEDYSNIQIGDCRPLSSQCFPLKQYNPKSLYLYSTKEVCLLTCTTLVKLN
jgi:hypothetical protein